MEQGGCEGGNHDGGGGQGGCGPEAHISVQLTPLDCNTLDIGMQALTVLVVVTGQYQIRAPLQWGIFLSG